MNKRERGERSSLNGEQLQFNQSHLEEAVRSNVQLVVIDVCLCSLHFLEAFFKACQQLLAEQLFFLGIRSRGAEKAPSVEGQACSLCIITTKKSCWGGMTALRWDREQGRIPNIISLLLAPPPSLLQLHQLGLILHQALVWGGLSA